MEEYPSLYSVIGIVLCVFLNAVMFGFGVAMQNTNEAILEKFVESGDVKAARLVQMIKNPGRFIITLQLVHMGTCYGVAGFFVRDERPWVRLFLLFAVLLFTIAIGIVVPKRLALKDSAGWLFRTLFLVRPLMFFLAPLVVLVNGLSFPVLKLFGIDVTRVEENVTEEDIMSMVNEGQEQGTLESSEAEMITNIFELNDKEAADVMTNRKSMVCIDGRQSLENIVEFMLTKGNNSRYPVYDGDIDNIIGILNMKDALIYLRKRNLAKRPLRSIRGILRKASFIPETRLLDSLFEEMQSRKIHMVIVIDEYGQTAGLVTMEDILEEIVGNIMDEYDIDEEQIVIRADGECRMKGLTDLEDVAEALEIKFDEEEYENFDTINGLMIAKLGRIPEDGENFSVFIHGYEFKALKVENRMISLVSVRMEKETAADEN